MSHPPIYLSCKKSRNPKALEGIAPYKSYSCERALFYRYAPESNQAHFSQIPSQSNMSFG